MSVDNYYNMLELTNNTGMITINYGYARYGTGPHPARTAAGYAADWVRYDNGRTKFWEIGNESSGPWQAGFRIDTSKNQDDQSLIISGNLYGEHFKIFIDSMKAAADEIGTEIYIGAQLIPYEASNSWNPPERHWNEDFFESAGNLADFYIVHSYYTPYNENSTASVILNSASTETVSMINYLKSYINTAGMEMKPVALTEWNPRPAFFYMYYFQKFFGDHALTTSVSGSSNVRAFASVFSSGELGIVVVNKTNSDQVIELSIPGFGFGNRYYMYSLTGGTDNGEFSQVVYVNGQGPDNLTGGPINNLVNIKAKSVIITDTIKFPSPA